MGGLSNGVLHSCSGYIEGQTQLLHATIAFLQRLKHDEVSHLFTTPKSGGEHSSSGVVNLALLLEDEDFDGDDSSEAGSSGEEAGSSDHEGEEEDWCFSWFSAMFLRCFLRVWRSLEQLTIFRTQRTMVQLELKSRFGSMCSAEMAAKFASYSRASEIVSDGYVCSNVLTWRSEAHACVLLCCDGRMRVLGHCCVVRDGLCSHTLACGSFFFVPRTLVQYGSKASRTD